MPKFVPKAGAISLLICDAASSLPSSQPQASLGRSRR